MPLCVGSPVNPKAVIVTGPDGYAKLQSEDGSTVEVFPSARVTFRADYPSWSDYVQVFMGRIRVMIDHHLGANPHRVSTPTAVISVRGTIFDVTNLDQEDTTEVAVEEGEVRVDHRIHPGYVILHANESTRIYANMAIAKVADHGGYGEGSPGAPPARPSRSSRYPPRWRWRPGTCGRSRRRIDRRRPGR